jgi:hypothetical protein
MAEIEVLVNKKQYHVPDTIETVEDFFEAIDYPTDRYELYLIDSGDTIGPLGEMLVFDEGDEFVAIPEYINNG